MKVLLLALLVTIYPTTGIVTETDTVTDTVTVTDFNGNQYQFNGVEDWQVNDIASIIMSDNGTENDITDDVILSVRYSGYIQ